ncbi:MAG: integron integrase, partial [Pseudomonadales bacterium]|nr:integron integrase [Pseudomonadales bacterium]
YIYWIRHYIKFHKDQHPNTMAEPEVERFLSYLAVNRNVAVNTQNQAFNALIFLYRHVLNKPLVGLDACRAKRARKLPAVLNRPEMKALLYELQGHNRLLASLMYGVGLRVSEALRIRVKDLDFHDARLHIHQGKGSKDRVVPLHPALIIPLQRHLSLVKQLHDTDLAAGYGEVHLPNALERKYPKAASSWAWQYVFPSQKLSADPRSDKTRRHHLHPSTIQSAIKTAAKRAEIHKLVGPHTLRLSFATHAIENGLEIHRVKDILGHESIETTKVYLHLTQQKGYDFDSPLESLFGAAALPTTKQVVHRDNPELNAFLEAFGP